ncbi:hypothetical protein ABIA44_005642 [Bradyrhizobium sp. USDA 329]
MRDRSKAVSSRKTKLSRPKVQLFPDRENIAGLVAEIGDDGREIIPTQDHVWMIFQDVRYVRLVVLAADRQQDAARLQFEQSDLEALESKPQFSLPNLDPIRAVLSQNASPHRIVEIDDHAFDASAALHQYGIADVLNQ